MKKILLIFVFLLLLPFVLSAQESVHYERIDKLLTSFFKEDLNENKIVFTINDKLYLIIVEKKDAYEHYYFEADTITDKKPQVKQMIIFKPNNLLETAFNTNNYHTGYIDFFSDFYKDGVEFSIGNPTYFVLLDKNGQKFGETELSAVVIPNPIDKEVYNYILTTTIAMMQY
ncbi:hypothetical protein [Flavobacterium alkalisoli]|uniref:hypothetical protein n=1 Tax=Flavobacterium alkalisoli TaxID=2602769 RepID=UPI003A8E4A7A